jgi:osmoprotectant transport system permease protein
MASGAILVAVLALLMDGVLALVQRTAVSPGLTGKFRNTPGNAPVVSSTARGDDASETASPTDRADDQREALV